jgi:hypothetical protein
MSPAASPEVSIRCGRREIAISHPDKALFTDPTITKLDLARHYEAIAEVMVPHVRDRPLALESYPQGTDHRGFYMKSVPKHFPDWIATANVPKKGGHNTQVLANEGAALVYLAGQNVVTPHVWLGRADALREPDRLIIDFDPNPGVSFATIRAAARDAGPACDGHGLARYPRRLPAAARPRLRGRAHVRPRRRRGDGRRQPEAPDARMAPRGARRTDLRRRQPDQLRPARRGAVRRAGAARRAGGDADPLGRAVARGAAA